MLIACVVTVAAILVVLFLDRWPKQKKYYIQFLYYSALLSILDTIDGVAENTIYNAATVVNSSITNGTTKSKYKKKRKGIRK